MVLLPLLVYVAIVQCACHAFDTALCRTRCNKTHFVDLVSETRVGPVWAIVMRSNGMYSPRVRVFNSPLSLDDEVL